MKSASEILLGPSFDDKPLFKSQLDLVTSLLNHPKSFYFLSPDRPKDDQARAQGRLKTYISQLFSTNVIRTVTEDFKNSLLLVLTDRLPKNEAEKICTDVIAALQQKNAALAPKEETISPASVKTNLQEDITNANYIVVITARPIDMDATMHESGFSIRRSFFEELIKNILSQTKEPPKYYRFNFPSETYGELFWSGLDKLLMKFLGSMPESKVFCEFLYEKFSITTETLSKYERYLNEKPDTPNDSSIRQKKEIVQAIAREITVRLNRNKIIMVFYNTHPIFSVPLIAINPNESTAKVYGLLDLDEQPNVVYKFSAENVLLWRIFYWDKIKASDNGQSVYHPALKTVDE